MEEDVLDEEDRKALNMFIDMGMPKGMAKTMMLMTNGKMKSPIEIFKMKHKRKKHLSSLIEEEEDEEEEELDEQYYDNSYNTYRYPPDSDSPSVNNNHSLNHEFMVIESNAW